MFVARYEGLLAVALQLTDRDRARAEDLLHETFIEFTLSRPDLAAIENPDGYLRQVLRNIHLSEFRKSTRQALRTISIAEYDSVSLGLRQLDPTARAQAQDDLRAICQYACLRRASSKAGSVFILRFFHGYFPGEIARLCCSSAPAISELVRAGRQEAVAWLRNPEQLHFLKATAAELKPLNFGRTVEDWEGELRGYILNSGSGTDCPAEEEWRDYYQQPAGSPLDVTRLAHLVSCEGCLDAVNHLLGLPSLAERCPSALRASAGNSRRRKRSGNDDDSGHSGGATAGGGATGDLGRKLKGYRRSAKEVYEHRPEQLAILVNGLFVVSQKLSAGHGEQVVRLGLDEEIGFIEVLSEQGVRLLMLGVEAPPRGEAVQSKLVHLSDERTVEAVISHREEQPT
ncbi:MAG: RNA polymerase sigma factor, partial [Burkholderiales bacterium]